ncbi:MAG: hypothetical protein R3Y68_08600 [Rikenellaceae bacterium]
MADKTKIFRLEINFGSGKTDIAEVIKLMDKFVQSTKNAKSIWAEMTKQFSSSKDMQAAISLLKTLEKAQTTATTARKTLTAEQRYANTLSRESRREEDLKLKSQNSLSGSIRQMEADVALLNAK